MKVQEMRNLSNDELKASLDDTKKKVYDLNFQRKYGRVEKPHQYRIWKKDIARVMTILKERENEK
jgi:large subunit ribosomal protein L29